MELCTFEQLEHDSADALCVYVWASNSHGRMALLTALFTTVTDACICCAEIVRMLLNLLLRFRYATRESCEVQLYVDAY